MQANLPGSRKLAGERAMRNAILCGSGFERASEATSNFRITEDARGHGRSLCQTQHAERRGAADDALAWQSAVVEAWSDIAALGRAEEQRKRTFTEDVVSRVGENATALE